jgi:hypothetical protein
VPINDDRGHRGVLGAASLGTVVGVRCAVGVQGSPTGRGAGSLCHAALSRRASIEIPKRSVFRDLKELTGPQQVPTAAVESLRMEKKF